MARKYFGTDGIRGVANQYLTADLALAVGRAAIETLGDGTPKIIIGRDTRISGPMLEAALVAGISSAGGRALKAGIVPTPAVASLILREEANAGAVISASHNPYQDNGIKFFGPSGFKLTDEQEAEIERHMTEQFVPPSAIDPGDVTTLDSPVENYVDNLVSRFDLDLSNMRIALDCANGAVYKSSPMAFRRLGALVSVISDRPDGFNINAGCGSTRIENIQEYMKTGEYDLGFSFDGDGDRVIAVDTDGNIVDGDFIMAICAGFLKKQGRLPADTVVTTVMTNLGFHLAMKELGIEVKTTAVGDRYVLEEMLAGGFGFGGEQSGHLINLKAGTTGDGLATALLLLEVISETGASLDELARVMERLPQKLVNVRVADKGGLQDAGEIWRKVEEKSSFLGDDGRILVRPSGTEQVVRVMVEASSAEICDAVCADIVPVVEQSLGKS